MAASSTSLLATTFPGETGCLLGRKSIDAFNGNSENFQNEDPRVKMLKDILWSKAKEKDQFNELIMIDVIQQLGLQYYFHENIRDALEKHYAKCCTNLENGDGDLYKVAVRFRLLRQGGYNAPVEIFNIFKDDNDGKLKPEVCKDIKGLLSLLEASMLSIQGEDIMDEAGELCVQALKATLNHITEQPKASIIENTLRKFHHKGIPRQLISKSFLYDYSVPLEFLHDFSGMKDWLSGLKDLSRYDFSMNQIKQKNEMQQILRWAKELNSSKELDFARIDPIKWYVWSLGTLPEPYMGEERIELAKLGSFIYIIDDIFDVYGTSNELYLFTEAIHRWDHADTRQLPDYMKVCFKSLHDMVNELSQAVDIKYGWNPKDSLRKLWADLCNAFLMEVNWAATGQLPSTADYLKTAIVSSGVHVLLGHAFFLLGDGEKSEGFLNNLPSIVTSTATIARLWNDIGRYKVKDRDGYDMSYIDCYMNEHKDISDESARKNAIKMISNGWKDLNEEHLRQASPLSTKFKDVCLNFARMLPIMYGSDESHRDYFRSFVKHLKSLLLNDSSLQ